MLDIPRYDVFINVDRSAHEPSVSSLAQLTIVTRQVVYNYVKDLPIGYMDYVDLPADPNIAFALGAQCMINHFQTKFPIQAHEIHQSDQYRSNFDSLAAFKNGTIAQAAKVVYPRVQVNEIETSGRYRFY